MSTSARVLVTGNDHLRKDLQDLRSKLDIIDAEMSRGEPQREVVRAIEEAVSTVRGNLWTLLSAQHTDDSQGFLGKIRVRRATELCEDVLADLHANTLTRATPGRQVFHATLQELAAMCKQHADRAVLHSDDAS